VPAKLPLPKKTKSFKEVMKRIIVGLMLGSMFAFAFNTLPIVMVTYVVLAGWQMSKDLGGLQRKPS